MIELIGIEGCKNSVTLSECDWYQVKENRAGPDMWQMNGRYTCGDLTEAGKYLRLCDSCARKEGVKW